MAATAKTSTPVRKRVGSPTSKTRAVIVESTEQVMLEEGYASVTYRSVAARAGVTAARDRSTTKRSRSWSGAWTRPSPHRSAGAALLPRQLLADSLLLRLLANAFAAARLVRRPFRCIARRPVADDGHAFDTSPFVVVADGVVLRDTVVPDSHGADRPAIAAHELRLFGERAEIVQERGALGAAQLEEVRRERPVHVQRATPR